MSRLAYVFLLALVLAFALALVLVRSAVARKGWLLSELVVPCCAKPGYKRPTSSILLSLTGRLALIAKVLGSDLGGGRLLRGPSEPGGLVGRHDAPGTSDENKRPKGIAGSLCKHDWQYSMHRSIALGNPLVWSWSGKANCKIFAKFANNLL